MALDFTQLPLLDILVDDTDATVRLASKRSPEHSTDIDQKLHKTFIALRQLYNTRDTSESTLPYGSFGGHGFGIPYLKVLLLPEECQTLFGYTLNELEHKFLTASTSADKGSGMAEFVRWATDIAIGYLFQDPVHVAARASWGTRHMRFAQESLQLYTSTVYNAIERKGDDEREDQAYGLLLLLLGDLFNAINEHHKKVPGSNAGIEELLAVGDETTFVRRGSNPPEDVRGLYTTVVVNYGLPKHQFLDMAEQVIARQLREQRHPMPVEYAVRILAPAITSLDTAVLQRLPIQQWLEWTKDLHLEHIGEEIASGVKAKLESLGKPLPESRALNSVLIQNYAPTVQSAASNATCMLAGLGNTHERPTTMFEDGWAGVQQPQEPKSSQSQESRNTVLPQVDDTGSTQERKRNNGKPTERSQAYSLARRNLRRHLKTFMAGQSGNR